MKHQEFDDEGSNTLGFNYNGFDEDGFDKEGFDEDGYDKDGFDRNGYDKEGFDYNGFDSTGYNREGFDDDLDMCQTINYNPQIDVINGTKICWLKKKRLLLSSITFFYVNTL